MADVRWLMRSKGLGILLSLCAAVALAPLVPWSLAAVFDRFDDRWLNSLDALPTVVPVALGLTAIVLALHGVLLQRALADRMESEFDDRLLRGMALAGTVQGTGAGTRVAAATTTSAPAAGGSQTTTAAPEATNGEATDAGAEAKPAKLGGKMAVAERPAGFGDPQAKKGKGDKAKRVGRRYGHRVTGAVRRKLRDNFRL